MLLSRWEEWVRYPAGLPLALALLSCSGGAVDSPRDKVRELIPAEWTVFEDTSGTGEVTTASLQLPATQDIEGLVEHDSPSLVLRCVDGKVQASIDTEGSDAVPGGSDSLGAPGQSVEIQLDSVPACE
jgi:hypothetical protein